MPEICKGVSFDKVAREWRCKWSDDADKASLVKCQEALDSVLAQVKGTAGVISVQRVVCGGCKDFKVIVQLDAESFGKWEGASFAPEAQFLEKIKAIGGVTTVETQTYTLMTI
eukprot:3933675-Pyramimonas_sp.AAC.2